jgi:hypothetical protein
LPPVVGDTLKKVPVFDEIDQRIFLLSVFLTVTDLDGAFCPWAAVELTEVGLTESSCADTADGNTVTGSIARIDRNARERRFMCDS